MRLDSNTKSQKRFDTKVLPLREDQQISGRLKSPTMTRCSLVLVRNFKNDTTCWVYVISELGGIYAVHRIIGL